MSSPSPASSLRQPASSMPDLSSTQSRHRSGSATSSRRPMTLRETEEAMTRLRGENFRLKLQIYHMENSDSSVSSTIDENTMIHTLKVRLEELESEASQHKEENEHLKWLLKAKDEQRTGGKSSLGGKPPLGGTPQGRPPAPGIHMECQTETDLTPAVVGDVQGAGDASADESMHNREERTIMKQQELLFEQENKLREATERETGFRAEIDQLKSKLADTEQRVQTSTPKDRLVPPLMGRPSTASTVYEGPLLPGGNRSMDVTRLTDKLADDSVFGMFGEDGFPRTSEQSARRTDGPPSFLGNRMALNLDDPVEVRAEIARLQDVLAKMEGNKEVEGESEAQKALQELLGVRSGDSSRDTSGHTRAPEQEKSHTERSRLASHQRVIETLKRVENRRIYDSMEHNLAANRSQSKAEQKQVADAATSFSFRSPGRLDSTQLEEESFALNATGLMQDVSQMLNLSNADTAQLRGSYNSLRNIIRILMVKLKGSERFLRAVLAWLRGRGDLPHDMSSMVAQLESFMSSEFGSGDRSVSALEVSIQTELNSTAEVLGIEAEGAEFVVKGDTDKQTPVTGLADKGSSPDSGWHGTMASPLSRTTTSRSATGSAGKSGYSGNEQTGQSIEKAELVSQITKLACDNETWATNYERQTAELRQAKEAVEGLQADVQELRRREDQLQIKLAQRSLQDQDQNMFAASYDLTDLLSLKSAENLTALITGLLDWIDMTLAGYDDSLLQGLRHRAVELLSTLVTKTSQGVDEASAPKHDVSSGRSESSALEQGMTNQDLQREELKQQLEALEKLYSSKCRRVEELEQRVLNQSPKARASSSGGSTPQSVTSSAVAAGRSPYPEADGHLNEKDESWDIVGYSKQARAPHGSDGAKILSPSLAKHYTKIEQELADKQRVLQEISLRVTRTLAYLEVEQNSEQEQGPVDVVQTLCDLAVELAAARKIMEEQVGASRQTVTSPSASAAALAVSELRGEIARLNAELTSKSEESATYRSKTEGLTSEVQRLLGHIESLRNGLSVKSQELEFAREKLTLFENDIGRLESELAEAREAGRPAETGVPGTPAADKVEKLNRELSFARDMAARREGELAALKHIAEAKDMELLTLREKISTLGQTDQLQRSLSGTPGSGTREVEGLKLELQQTREELTLWKRKCEEADRFTQELKGKLLKAESELHTLKAESTKLRDRKVRIEAASSPMAGQDGSTGRAADRQGRGSFGASIENINVDSVLQKLQENNRDLEQKISDLQASEKKNVDSKNQLKQRVLSDLETMRKLKQTVADRNSEIKVLREKLQAQTPRREGASAANVQARSNAQQVGTQLQSSKSVIEQVRNLVAQFSKGEGDGELQEFLESLINRCVEMERNLSEMGSLLSSLQNEDYNSCCVNVELKNVELEAKVIRLEGEIEHLGQNYQDKERNWKDLERAVGKELVKTRKTLQQTKEKIKAGK